VTVWVLGDQLCAGHSALAAADRKRDRVLMVESALRGSHVRYHKVKLAMVYAAMRHFARQLRGDGWDVDYRELGAGEDFFSALSSHMAGERRREAVMMEPNALFERGAVLAAAARAEVSLVFTRPVQFLRERDEFASWARGKKRLLMETHYREMRRRFGILVDAGGQPEGGTWNLDAGNRKTVSDWRRSGKPVPPTRKRPVHDALTLRAIADVENSFPDAPGEAANLWAPVTREEALGALRDFTAHRLQAFGDYEDVMVADQPRLFHSLLSAPLNLGLLTPMECIEAAVAALRGGRAPLNAVEGFVRQILGWREFVNGIYWLKMPGYAGLNALGATRDLPDFFYTGDTAMRCLRIALEETLSSAYNHHIQRLMVLGNFLLLAGISPSQSLRWFSEMYLDAFDWVMAPNVLGMSLHADGGFMATKPYAASAAYISKMSDYCTGCHFSPSQKSGPRACPFNLLYWDFYDRHRDRFASNPRTAMMVRSWMRRTPAGRRSITTQARAFLASLAPGGPSAGGQRAIQPRPGDRG
jgi:deoxyribodipyrimidine photolyase-related protein